MAKRLLGALIIVFAFMAFPSSAFAQDLGDEGLCRQWGLNIWGLSYHTRKNFDYNAANWGAGLSCYERPDWKWLGKSEDNRVFLRTDTMLNSYNGLLVLAASGVEYKLMTVPGDCKVFADAALTLAYYVNPVREETQVMFGPVPGVSLGCGSFKSNIVFVPSDKHHPLAAVTVSFTILFK